MNRFCVEPAFYLALFYPHFRKEQFRMSEKIELYGPDGRRLHYRGEKDMKWIERFSKTMDSRFIIPGTKIKFGIDPVLSLFPVIGDLMTFLLSGILIYTMHQQGASRNVVIKMVLNSTLDAIIGTIPLVGTVFDVFYRSNDRNVRLLKEHYFEGKHQGSGNGLLYTVIICALIIVAAAFYGMYKLLEAIF
jgi:hypothetical protein